MTICVVCDVLGRENNGTTIAAMNLIRSLRAKGHTVRVICPDKERSGEQDYYIVPALPLGPLKNYVKKNGVAVCDFMCRTAAAPDNFAYYEYIRK